jgi:hypothetical protein
MGMQEGRRGMKEDYRRAKGGGGRMGYIQMYTISM